MLFVLAAFREDEPHICFCPDMSALNRHPLQEDSDVLPSFGGVGGGWPYSGGYSGGVPPLPIPNREVKPARADGTAHPWESR